MGHTQDVGGQPNLHDLQVSLDVTLSNDQLGRFRLIDLVDELVERLIVKLCYVDLYSRKILAHDSSRALSEPVTDHVQCSFFAPWLVVVKLPMSGKPRTPDTDWAFVT
eukprot:CAMPEP_0194542894 /NCGR_PEP_ID=MMETSP0253-20130528/84854_1 /TAXON_ID=2966 /ORGANISM="Noctiluca scintillans" /LENGTH=107 /DNA_ID=CAMNT_0039389581 /DNA_START=123 /DNA_END=443 /DNA_ORIENTATION=-